MSNKNGDAYWKANLSLVGMLGIVWLVTWLVLSILMFPVFEGIRVGGASLGFWFAQQGSILIFLVLIFFYAWRMNKIDKDFDVDE